MSKYLDLEDALPECVSLEIIIDYSAKKLSIGLVDNKHDCMVDNKSVNFKVLDVEIPLSIIVDEYKLGLMYHGVF